MDNTLREHVRWRSRLLRSAALPGAALVGTTLTTEGFSWKLEQSSRPFAARPLAVPITPADL